jgi:hypothetical protein
LKSNPRRLVFEILLAARSLCSCFAVLRIQGTPHEKDMQVVTSVPSRAPHLTASKSTAGRDPCERPPLRASAGLVEQQRDDTRGALDGGFDRRDRVVVDEALRHADDGVGEGGGIDPGLKRAGCLLLVV